MTHEEARRLAARCAERLERELRERCDVVLGEGAKTLVHDVLEDELGPPIPAWAIDAFLRVLRPVPESDREAE